MGVVSLLRVPHRSMALRRALATSSKSCGATSKVPWDRSVTLKSLAIGVIAGSLGSLVGMGGAFVAIPFLTGPALQLTQHAATGTSMAAVLATSVGGCSTAVFDHQTQRLLAADHCGDATKDPSPGQIDVLTACCVSLTAGVFARRGAMATVQLTPRQLKLTMGAFQLCVAPLVHLREYVRGGGGSSASKAVAVPVGIHPVCSQLLSRLGCSTSTSPCQWSVFEGCKMLAVGVFSGFLAGVFGVGGGAVVVPALCLCTDLSYHSALLTSLAAMLPTAFFGSLQHYRQGTMVVRVAGPLAAGCALGSLAGGRLVQHVDAGALTWVFSAVMLLLGGRTLRQGLVMRAAAAVR